MQQGGDRRLHLSFGGRHADYVRHIVLDPDLLVGNLPTAADKNAQVRTSAQHGYHVQGNRIYFSHSAGEKSQVTISLFDVNGRELCSSDDIGRSDRGIAVLDSGRRTGIFLVRASVDGITLPAEKVVLK
ncbi:MAG: hypothetical protein GF350_10865 [Chitinivibrionales bacterium]|nr:hypothetical protein [Chitinivibrionales bacterium]